jgi:hypothetical protein
VSIGETIAECAEAMRKVLHVARANPDLTRLPPQPLKIVTNASLVAAVLVFANRSLMYPETIGDLSHFGLSMVIAISSLILVFMISAIISLVRTDPKADEIADRWSFFLVFVWFVTLLIFFVDQLFHTRFGEFLSHQGAGDFFGHDRGILMQFLGYSVIAYIILLLRTYLLERSLVSFGSSVLSFIIVVPICVIMLYAFMRIGLS